MSEKIKYFNENISAEMFIRECETDFESQLDAAIGEIKNRLSAQPDIRIITLSGPTCSGKTTTAGKLISALGEMGMRIFSVSLDDFFKSVDADLDSYSESNELLDLDSVDAIDVEYLRKFISGVFSRERVYLPYFDFHIQTCTGYRAVDSGRYDIILLEGIQAVYPAVRALLRGHQFISIFTNAASGVAVGDVYFDCREVRFMRRILRDNLFRSASVEFTVQVWRNVVANEESSILPGEKYADISVDSTLAYEPCVIKEPLLRLLDKVKEDYPLYPTVKAIADKLKLIPSLPSDLVPDRSVFREFIGSK